MKTYNVTIWRTLNMVEDYDLDEPRLLRDEFKVKAGSEELALMKAKELHSNKHHKGVWDHTIEED